MTVDNIKRMLDAFYQAKRVRDMLRYTRNTATPIAFDESRSIIPGTF